MPIRPEDLLQAAERRRDETLDRILRRSLLEYRLPTVQIDDNTGRALQLLTRLHAPKRVVELGTLFGYSTIYMARGLPPGGHITSVERDPIAAVIARANLDEAGVGDRVQVVEGDGATVLEGLESGSVDMVFIDADKRSYPRYVALAAARLRLGGLLVIDDALGRGDFSGEDGWSQHDGPAADQTILASVWKLLNSASFLTFLMPTTAGLLVGLKESL